MSACESISYFLNKCHMISQVQASGYNTSMSHECEGKCTKEPCIFLKDSQGQFTLDDVSTRAVVCSCLMSATHPLI